MLKFRGIVMRMCVLLSLAWFPSAAFGQSGHTAWGPWSFDWRVLGDAGLNLLNVYYNGELVIHKANLPVIRVRYDNDQCGPYQDLISSGLLIPVPFTGCGNTLVCQKSYTLHGRNWLEIGVLAKISQYLIYHVWYLSDDGYLYPRVHSAGLQCPSNGGWVDHHHHPYWRLDVDVGGAASDDVFVYDNNRPDQGWGPGWHRYPQELNDLKNPATDRKWFVRDHVTGHGVWVLPESDAGADSFSNKDVGARLYSSPEDQPWPFGAWGHLGYDNGENIEEKDIVFWYIGHLFHAASEGPFQYKGVGPQLKVER